MRNDNAFTSVQGAPPGEEKVDPAKMQELQRRVAACMLDTFIRFKTPPTFKPGDLVQPASAPHLSPGYEFPLPGVVLREVVNLAEHTEEIADTNVLAYLIARLDPFDDEFVRVERVVLPAYQLDPYAGPMLDGA